MHHSSCNTKALPSRKKLIIFGAAGSEGQSIKALASFSAEKLKNTIHMHPRGSYRRKHMRVGFATFCCRGEFVIPYSRDWGKTHNSYENLLLWHWSLFCSSWLFFSVSWKMKEVNPTMHENILKGSCNFFAVFLFSPNLNNMIWGLEKVLQSCYCQYTPQTQHHQDRELHQVHLWSVQYQLYQPLQWCEKDESNLL